MAVLTATGVQSEAHLPFAGLHRMLRPVRERVAELPGVQRGALEAAFGLSEEVAPEPYRIAMAALDLVSEVAAERPVLLVVDDAHWSMPRRAGSLNGSSIRTILPTTCTSRAWASVTSQRPRRTPAA